MSLTQFLDTCWFLYHSCFEADILRKENLNGDGQQFRHYYTSDGYYTTSNTTFKTEKHSKHTKTGNRIKKDAKNTKNKQNICTKTQTFINLYCFKHTSSSQCQS
jgi:hypothetical protein